MKHLDYILKVQKLTLKSLEYTLNHIFLSDRCVKQYQVVEESCKVAEP